MPVRLRACRLDGASPDLPSSRKWRNWQTHQLEGLAVAIPWGFESPLPHQSLTAIFSSREWSIGQVLGQVFGPGVAEYARRRFDLPPSLASSGGFRPAIPSV